MAASDTSPSGFRGGVMAPWEGGPILLGNGLKDSHLGIWHFFTAEQRWERLDDASGGPHPAGRRMPAAALWGDRVFCFGGKQGERYLNDLWFFDLSSKKWKHLDKEEEIRKHPKPGARYAAAFAADRKGFWLWGGLGPEGLTNDVWRFDAEHSEFHRVFAGSPPGGLQGREDEDTAVGGPSRRYGATMTLHGSDLYLFGGYTSRIDLEAKRTLFNDVWRFDTRSFQWSRVQKDTGFTYWKGEGRPSENPYGRYCHAAAVWKNALVVGCGATGGLEGFGWRFLSDFWVLDFTEKPLRWQLWEPEEKKIRGKEEGRVEGLKAPAFCQEGPAWFLFGGQDCDGHSDALFVIDLTEIRSRETGDPLLLGVRPNLMRRGERHE